MNLFPRFCYRWFYIETDPNQYTNFIYVHTYVNTYIKCLAKIQQFHNNYYYIATYVYTY